MSDFNEENMLNKTIEIAAKAHAGQVDRVGKAYILHPLRVMMSICTDKERTKKYKDAANRINQKLQAKLDSK